LPNGAIRSPDAAWIRQERWDALTPEEKQSFVPLCPDFVVELCSHSDSKEDLPAKMQEYLANSIRLGWLIDPKTKQVEVYRPNQVIEIQATPLTLLGETVLPGFILDLKEIWHD
jgi:Uma2 family endonuclease